MNRPYWHLESPEERAVQERLAKLTVEELRGVIDRTTDQEQVRTLQAEYRRRRVRARLETRVGTGTMKWRS